MLCPECRGFGCETCDHGQITADQLKHLRPGMAPCTRCNTEGILSFQYRIWPTCKGEQYCPSMWQERLANRLYPSI
jgi:hypothetical protein